MRPLILCLLFAFLPSPRQAAGETTSIETLRASLDEYISQARFASGFWGIQIVSLDTGGILYEHFPDKLFSPASNAKLFTAALALDRLGENYRIKTSVFAKQPADRSGVLEGDLILYGRGDPGFTSRLFDNNLARAFAPFADHLSQIKRIKGNIVADVTFFRRASLGSGWAIEDLNNYYGAEVSALSVNDNVVELIVRPGSTPGAPARIETAPANSPLTITNAIRTAPPNAVRRIRFDRPLGKNIVFASGKIPEGTNVFRDEITFSDPGLFFASSVRDALSRQGTKIDGGLRLIDDWNRWESPPLSNLVEIAVLQSQPVSEIIRHIQKPSNNLYTDLLLAHIGERARPVNDPDRSSEDLGLFELRKFTQKIGIRPSDLQFDEGSGLSRNNLVTPHAIVQLLQFMARHASSKAFIDSLPVAGVDGTLKKRFKNTAAQGVVQAKTGTLRWANSLSGYGRTARGERLAFSILSNRHLASNKSQPNDVDTLVQMLIEFSGKTSVTNGALDGTSSGPARAKAFSTP